MNFAGYGILAFLGVFWFYGLKLGLKEPKKLFFISVATISCINFSFFGGEILSRLAIPDVLFLTLFIVMLIRSIILKKSQFRLPPKLLIVSVLFLSALLFSFVSAPWNRGMNFGDGSINAVVFGFVILFLALSLIKTEQDLSRYLNMWVVAILIALSVSAIDAIDLFSHRPDIQYDDYGFFGVQDLMNWSDFSHPILSPYSFRLIGSFRSSGQLAIFSSTAFFVILASVFIPRRRGIEQVGLLLACGGLLFCVVFAGRSSIYITMIAGFILLAGYGFFQWGGGFKMLRWSLGIAVLVGGFLTLVFTNAHLFNMLFSRNFDDVFNLFQNKGFFSEQALQSFQLFFSNPLFGIGYDRFIESQYQGEIRGYGLHSTYFALLAESGLVGFVAYMAFMAYFFKKLFEGLKKSWHTPWQHFFVILFIGFCSFLISYGYNRHLKERTFWLYAALICTAYSILRHKMSQVMSGSSFEGELGDSKK